MSAEVLVFSTFIFLGLVYLGACLYALFLIYEPRKKTKLWDKSDAAIFAAQMQSDRPIVDGPLYEFLKSALDSDKMIVRHYDEHGNLIGEREVGK